MNLSLEQVRLYSIFAIIFSALIIILLERLYPYEKNQKFLREGFVDDFILYTLVQSYALGYLISYIIQFIDNQTQLSRLQLVSDWPIWVQIIFFLIVHDF